MQGWCVGDVHLPGPPSVAPAAGRPHTPASCSACNGMPQTERCPRTLTAWLSAVCGRCIAGIGLASAEQPGAAHAAWSTAADNATKANSGTLGRHVLRADARVSVAWPTHAMLRRICAPGPVWLIWRVSRRPSTHACGYVANAGSSAGVTQCQVSSDAVSTNQSGSG